MRAAPLEPARLERDADGTPVSSRYGDVYASRDGALAQARHVFLGGNGLPARWRDRAQFVVLETGFGLGTNFLATWQAWRADLQRPRRLHFVSVERHPLPADDLAAAAPPELADLARRLAAQWPLAVPGLHRLHFGLDADDEFAAPQITLTLALGDAAALLPQLALGADAIYLDGFAPARNPELWSAPLLKAAARLARPGATLATWCCARPVREALAAGGFELETRAGFGRKREMLAGRYAPRYVLRRHEPPAANAGERSALVVGSGLAGCSAALALAARGWQVQLLECGTSLAAGASALPAGLLHPQLAADDSRLARLTRAGFLRSLQWLRRLDAGGGLARIDGLFQQADSEAEAQRWRAALQAQRLPLAFAEVIDTEAAAGRLGRRPRRAGLWFAQGAAVAAGRWCEAMVAAAGARVSLRCAATVERLQRVEGGWCAHLADGGALAAPVVVNAAAGAGPGLAGLRHAPLQLLRGRLSILAAGDLPGLRAALAGDGYAMHAPGVDGRALLGASYEPVPPGSPKADAAALAFGPTGLDAAAIHAANVGRLARLLADPPPVRPAAMFDGLRAVAADRLPLAGLPGDEARALAAAVALRGAQLRDLPRQPGAAALFALGSRGLALAPLLADLVAAQLEGEPWPIERDLAASVDPARFLLDALRHARAGADPGPATPAA